MKFIILEGFKKLKNYKKLTLITFLVSVISYLLLGLFLITSSSVIENFNLFQQSEIKVISFIKSSISENELEIVKAQIKNLPGITKTEFISNEAGLDKIKVDFENDEVISNLEEDNPLPHTIIASFKTTKEADRAYNKLKNNTYIENLSYEKEYLSEINNTIKNIKFALTTIVVGMILSSVFFIVIVINLSVHNQQQVIKVMALIGAPPKYIKGPFIVQGLIISITSSIISSFLTIHIYKNSIESIQKILPFIKTVDSSMIYTDIPLIIISLGILLGSVGSYIASKHELKKVY